MKVRAELRLRNAVMTSRRKELRLSQKALSLIVGVEVAFIQALEMFRCPNRSPKHIEKTENSIRDIAEVLGITADEIMPESLKEQRIPAKLVAFSDVDPIQIENLLAPTPQKLLPEDPAAERAKKHERQAAIELVLETLTYREREIIKLRYGLNDGESYTLEEVGRLFQVTREQIRQVELKAIRKLQNPIRAKHLVNLY